MQEIATGEVRHAVKHLRPKKEMLSGEGRAVDGKAHWLLIMRGPAVRHRPLQMILNAFK